MNRFSRYLKRIDFFILINRPLMWRTRVHYFLIYGLVANSLLFLLLFTISIGSDLSAFDISNGYMSWLSFIIFIIAMLLLTLFWKDNQEPLYNIKQCWMVIAGYTVSWLCFILFFTVLIVLFFLPNEYNKFLVGVNILLFSIPLGISRFILLNYIKVNLIKILFIATIGLYIILGIVVLMMEYPTTMVFLFVVGGVAFFYYKSHGAAIFIEFIKQGLRYFLVAFAFSLSIAICILLVIISVSDELNDSQVLVYSYGMLGGFYLVSWGLMSLLNRLYIMPRLIN